MMRRLALIVGPVVVLGAMRLAFDQPSTVEPKPARPEAVLVLSDDSPQPGQVVTLRIDTRFRTTIGLDSMLDRWTSTGWQPAFHLIKEHFGPASYFAVGTSENRAIPDVGLDGERRWPIMIPREAFPGLWRIREDVSFNSPSETGIVELSVGFLFSG